MAAASLPVVLGSGYSIAVVYYHENQARVDQSNACRAQLQPGTVSVGSSLAFCDNMVQYVENVLTEVALERQLFVDMIFGWSQMNLFGSRISYAHT